MIEPTITTEVVIVKDERGNERIELQQFEHATFTDATGTLHTVKRPIDEPPVISSAEAERIKQAAEAQINPKGIHPLLSVDYSHYDFETGGGHYVVINLPLRAYVHTAALEDDPEAELNEAFGNLQRHLEGSLRLLRERTDRPAFEQRIVKK